MKKNTINGLTVRGYDLVTILENKKPEKGNRNISHQIEDAIYQFKSDTNKKRFINNPEKYLPRYGGFCSIAMSEGVLVDANPKSFIIKDNKLFLFFSQYFMIVDTRRQWRVTPIELEKLADENWESLKNE